MSEGPEFADGGGQFSPDVPRDEDAVDETPEDRLVWLAERVAGRSLMGQLSGVLHAIDQAEDSVKSLSALNEELPEGLKVDQRALFTTTMSDFDTSVLSAGLQVIGILVDGPLADRARTFMERLEAEKKAVDTSDFFTEEEHAQIKAARDRLYDKHEREFAIKAIMSLGATREEAEKAYDESEAQSFPADVVSNDWSGD